jgi:hypothetical protein
MESGASSGSHRSGLLTAGGVLSIVAGALHIIVVLVLAGLAAAGLIWGGFHPFPYIPWMQEHLGLLIPAGLIGVGVFLLALAIVAVVGGVFALRRKSFGMALAGAICALLGPTILLGVLAVIFVAASRREFEAQK